MNRRKVAFAIALVTMVALLSVGVVEVVLRAYAGVADTGLATALQVDPYAVLVEPHGEFGYRPRPERTHEYPNGTAAYTNAMGFRGPEVAVPKPPGTFRIVLMGGSTTFGWGVADDETIDSHMRRALDGRYPDRSIEVVNLAFDGYDSYQLFERFQSDGGRLEPDVVILNTGVNDVAHAWYRDLRDGDPRSLLYKATMDQLRLEQELGGPTLWSRTKHWFYLARLPGWLRQQAGRAAVTSASAGEGPQPTPHWDLLEYFERNLRRLIELGTRGDRALVLLSTPPSSLRTKYDPDDPPARHYWILNAENTQVYRDSLSVRLQSLADQEAANGRPVAFVPHDELPPTLFLDDAHLTSEGNRRVAEEFVLALEPWLSNPAPGNVP